MDDIYLDTLREQGIALSILNNEDEGIKKYPSLKELDKKQGSTNKSFLSRRSEEEDADLLSQYHSKRKSTYDKDSSYGEKSLKKEEGSASFKGLNLGYDISD